MWKWQSGECKVLQGHKEQVRCFSPLSNSPDNTRLLSWSFDGTVKVKQTHTYTDTLVSAALNQIQNKISLFLSLVLYKMWDVESGEKLQDIEAHRGAILSCHASPDGCHFATTSADKTAKVQHLHTHMG